MSNKPETQLAHVQGAGGLRERIQKEFVVDEARRLQCSTSWVWRRLTLGYYKGVVIKQSSRRRRWVVGEPVLTDGPGHEIKVIHFQAKSEKREIRIGPRRGTPEQYAIRRHRAGVPEPKSKGHTCMYDKFEPQGPICGAAFDKVLEELRAIDQRREARAA